MIKEIRKIIENDLPKQVGETLKGVLEQGEKDAENVKELQERMREKQSYINDLGEKIREKNAKIDEYKNFDERNLNLDNRDQEVVNAENALKVTLLEIRIEESEKRADMVMEFTQGLVRNTSFKQKVFESAGQGPFNDATGCTQYPGSLSKTVDTENLAE